MTRKRPSYETWRLCLNFQDKILEKKSNLKSSYMLEVPEILYLSTVVVGLLLLLKTLQRLSTEIIDQRSDVAYRDLPPRKIRINKIYSNINYINNNHKKNLRKVCP